MTKKGKGWYFHPNEHALASKGVKMTTKGVKSKFINKEITKADKGLDWVSINISEIDSLKCSWMKEDNIQYLTELNDILPKYAKISILDIPTRYELWFEYEPYKISSKEYTEMMDELDDRMYSFFHKGHMIMYRILKDLKSELRFMKIKRDDIK